METAITRDTDIIREYLAALDASERGISPFARLAATVKLARLRRELDDAHLETTDDDVLALRREIDERLDRSFVRRFESRPWGARVSVFLMLVLGQQLILALVLLATKLFVELSPVPKRWHPTLPHEEPVFLLIFIFFFFFATPMLALAVLFGGRYFRSWRKTVPATLIIFALAVLGTYLVTRNRERNNPLRHSASLAQIAKDRGLPNTESYRQWVEASWLMRDPKFQRDYESYLRNGPGRKITSAFKDDAAWRDAMPVINEYLNSGQDPDGFRNWLEYYFDRNRIFSEDRVAMEADAVASAENQPFLGIWQVEPILKERDEHLYRAYLGSINRAMKIWGIAFMALFTLVFLILYLTGPALSLWERMAGNLSGRARRQPQDSFGEAEPVPAGPVSRLREKYYSFPERRDITTPPFFDTPFRLLAHVHRSFLRLAVFTSIFVFLFWAAVYAVSLSMGNDNKPSQIALMRSHLLLGGSGEEQETVALAYAPDQGYTSSYLGSYLAGQPPYSQPSYSQQTQSGERAPVNAFGPIATTQPRDREELLAALVTDLGARLDEGEYQSSKRFKEQNAIIASQRTRIDEMNYLLAQIQQPSSSLPAQVAALPDPRLDQAITDASVARKRAEDLATEINKELQEIKDRAASAATQAGQVDQQASSINERLIALAREFDNYVRQTNAQTEELGRRTENLNEYEARLTRLQQVAFTAIVSNIKREVDDFESRVGSRFYRLFTKGEAQREAEALRQRIARIVAELREMNTDAAKQTVEQLNDLDKRVVEVASRVK
ncbi:MAG TPA: hypothetical protein VF131_13065 [Blastocatellia bacterium]|nr:hypothetical protein [Blastocatellia bacterium]